MKIKLTILALSFFIRLFAHNGINIITDKVFDAKTNEPLPLVSVTVTDLKTGTSTDFEGTFMLILPDGSYKLEFKTLGYAPVVKEIEVRNHKTVFLTIRMEEAKQELDEVVIKVSHRKNTETSVLSLQKNTIAIVDGLSSQTFRNSGLNNIATAVKKMLVLV